MIAARRGASRFTTRSVVPHCGFAALFVVVLLLCGSESARASGEPFTLTGHDLQIDADTRWVGCSRGGYCPVRVRVINRGPTRTLTFRVARFGGQTLPTVRQTLEVPQNATLALTLSVPMVSETTNGEFRVEHNGSPLDKMTHTISFPDSAPWERSRPSLIVVAPGVVETQPFEDGVSTVMNATAGAVAGRHYGHRSPSTLVLPPSSLPRAWIDYSGVDIVAITFDVFSKLPRESRSALIQWSRCGGTLLITNVGDFVKERSVIEALLTPETTSTTTWEWRDASLDQRNATQIVSIDPAGAASTTSPPPQNVPGEWSRESPPFRVSNVSFGRVALFQHDPFPGTAHDWYWLLNSVGGPSHCCWMSRTGVSARGGNPDFLQFLIPGLRGVPVVMFLVLITLFAIVIGPINYLVLSRKKQLHLLILSIPAIALVTSLFLFGYAVVAHGFGVKARTRSLTWIDQTTQTAVTQNRLSLYAGQAPSGGLQFSRDTAIYPIWPEGERFEAGHVDWTDSQVLTSGWLRSRTRTQFLTVRHRTERGRLEIKPQNADQLTVANGFEWGFESLVVQNDQGQLFVGHDIAAGASADLKRVLNDGEFKPITDQLLRYPLELPDGVTGINRNDLMWGGHPYRSRYMYGYGSGPEMPAAATSQIEQTWSQLKGIQQLPVGGLLRKRLFFGLTLNSPNVELGVSQANEVASSHVVMGAW